MNLLPSRLLNVVAGIDELQAIPIEYETYQKLGVATYAAARSIEVRNNLPDQRMSIYPDHVLQCLSDQVEILSSPGYI